MTFSGELAAVGPRNVPDGVQSGPFYHVMALVYALVEPTGGAALPSSHVAVAVTTVGFTWRWLPRLRWVHLVVTVLLCISTVYCGYHYGVDVIAGLIAAAVLVPLANLLHRRCGSAGDDETCSARRDAGGSAG